MPDAVPIPVAKDVQPTSRYQWGMAMDTHLLEGTDLTRERHNFTVTQKA